MAALIAPPIIRAERVSKSFVVPHDRVHTMKETVLRAGRRRSAERLDALRDVSFEVARGEFLGIVGRNGSGKSTLLRCLAGIYAVDAGALYAQGRIAAFIELGVGFNPDLAAEDNIVLNGTMLGLTVREARRRYDRIMDFAELHEHADLKIKNYSSGMLVRLAFAVMVQVDADIVLVDEVLAVGDAAFQQKCHDEFARLRADGTTVLLITHDMGAVERYCDRAMLLERGEVVDIGAPRTVAERYLRVNFDTSAREPVASAAAPDDPLAPDRWGDGAARIEDAWFEDADGVRSEVLQSGERCAYAARVRFDAEVADPLFGVNLHDREGRKLLTANNSLEGPSGTFAPGDVVEFRIGLMNVFAAGRYLASPAVAHSGGGLKWIDRCVNLHEVTVIAGRPTDALIAPPYEFALTRAVARTAG